jgi:spore coat protein U-like protein
MSVVLSQIRNYNNKRLRDIKTLKEKVKPFVELSFGIRKLLITSCFLPILLFSLITISPSTIFAIDVRCDSSYSTGNAINMGSFNPYNYTNIVLPVTLSITCDTNYSSTGVSYTYTLSAGSSGNQNARRMVLSTNYLNYGICTSSSCTQNYGNGSSSTYRVSKSYTATTKDRTDRWTLYFVVPVQPLSTPGTYNDSITGTLSYTY